jgi:RecB family exonuclease
MGTEIARVFVGWERPLLHSLVELIRERARAGASNDFGSMTVVLAGARAGRRLLELLTNGRGEVVIPPRILTLGAWTAMGARAGGPPAGTLGRLAAWTAALGAIGEAGRHAIAAVGSSAGEGGTSRWLAIARLIDAAHAELSGEGLRFADVVRRGADVQDFTDADRWTALADAQALYERELAAAGLVDAGLATIEALEQRAVNRDALVGDGVVLLAGISEMNAGARRMVDAVAGRCVAIVPAPPDEAARFDGYGCVVPGAWEGMRIDLPDGAVFAADGPEHQAGAALRCIERICADSHGGDTAADQITIGVPDAEVEERVRRLAGRMGNVPVRRAEGRAVAFTRPVKLLLAVAEYLERRDFASLASLARHPDVERWIAATVHARKASGARPELWPTLLDRYQSEHLHARVDGEWFTVKPGERRVLDALHAALNELLGSGGPQPLLDDEAREACCWCARIWEVIRSVYSARREEDGPSLFHDRPDAATQEACFVLQAHLAELAALPAPLAGALRLTPAETIRLVVQQAAGDAIPESGEGAAIDLVGWLELAADDAPWVIVTGMNEGSAPAAAAADPLLPEGLRRVLGIRDRRSRMARDAHAVVMIARSRPAGRASFIFGRRSALGDRLAPSRLLLMGDDRSLLSRVRAWTGEDGAAAEAGPLLLPHAERSAFVGPLRIPPLVREIEEMSVTSFRHYIESPYGFYLMHVEKLKEIADDAVELDPLGFGNLIHEVVVKLLDEEMSACEDPERLASFLFGHLEGVANLRFGADPRPEVWVQLEQARSRLRAFARAQAAWAAQGWRVRATEWAPGERTASLVVDDKPMYLRGRIDRVDVNIKTNAWAILDYKTGTKKPSETSARTANGEWRDPQLALYRHLARDLRRELRVESEPVLGWIALPAAAADTEFVVARWTADQLAEADATMDEIVRRVRRGEFGDPGRRRPFEGVLGLLTGGLTSGGDA